jgi:hypothetical protein
MVEEWKLAGAVFVCPGRCLIWSLGVKVLLGVSTICMPDLIIAFSASQWLLRDAAFSVCKFAAATWIQLSNRSYEAVQDGTDLLANSKVASWKGTTIWNMLTSRARYWVDVLHNGCENDSSVNRLYSRFGSLLLVFMFEKVSVQQSVARFHLHFANIVYEDEPSEGHDCHVRCALRLNSSQNISFIFK